MKRLFVFAVLCVGGITAFAMGQARPQLFNAEPTPELLSEVRKEFGSVPNGTPLEKSRRLDLAVRIIQVDLLLGDKGSKRFAAMAIKPHDAKKALDALQQLKPPALNDTKNPRTRRILWDAIGAAHPAYRFYLEAVRLAGYEDDRDILDKTLHSLLSSWTLGNNLRPLSEVREPIGLWGRDVLSDCLRLQMIQDAPSAFKQTADVMLVLESMTKRPRTLGDPPAMSTRPFPLLRASGRVSPFDIAVHRACALQRAGFGVTFWSLLAERTIDATTKTFAQEPLIVFPEKPGEEPIIAMAADEVLKPLKGESIALGICRLPSMKSLDSFLVERGQFRVRMSEVLEANAAPLAWAKEIQRVLTTRQGAGTAREILIELNSLDSCAAFNTGAAESFAEVPRNAFSKTLRARSMRLTVTLIKNGKAAPSVTITDLDQREEDLVLARHEAAMGRAFQILPSKIFRGVETIQLQSEPLNELRKIGTQEGTRVVIREAEIPLPGRGWSNRLMMAAPNFQLGVHELFHCWAFNRHESFTVGDWKGTVITAFNEINWERPMDGPGWTVRGGAARTDDFANPYGATNQNEDLATMGEFYVLTPKALRAQVRLQLKKGNLILPVKYLFMKHIALLDMDGKSIEYETDVIDPPFTKAEFDKGVKLLADRKKLSDEQIRLVETATRIVALKQEMTRGKKIVRR